MGVRFDLRKGSFLEKDVAEFYWIFCDSFHVPHLREETSELLQYAREEVLDKETGLILFKPFSLHGAATFELHRQENDGFYVAGNNDPYSPLSPLGKPPQKLFEEEIGRYLRNKTVRHRFRDVPALVPPIIIV